ncbi:hypothetical protein Golomagni_02420 [Golovinomyces magnicellulatus]|nr:hypothetical protein Golomagni_02420 [Golovinomyces magnicellulatus]
MSSNPHLNFYSGKNALRDYYNPDLQPLIPLVEIPQKLNPFYDDGVRIYGKMMTSLPAKNVKSLPALNMLLSPEISSSTKTIVEYSSGSTIMAMSIIARVLHGIEDTRSYLSNKADHAKLRLIRFFGLNITLFSGPSQPEPDDYRGGICRAEKLSEDDPSVFNPNQYENELNWKAHFRWTGPQLLKQLPNMNVFCAGLGTSGTMTGVGMYLKKERPEVFRVGVNNLPCEIVPGTRSVALMEPIKFPWKEAVDTVEEVGSFDAYRLSLALTREGLICGPSSGLNLQGLYDFFSRRKRENSLHELAGGDGLVHSAFICCDLPYQYVEEYYEKLPDSYFPEIKNKCLLEVDRYHYDKSWEINSTILLPRLYPELLNYSSISSWKEVLDGSILRVKDNQIWDLRTVVHFDNWHLPGAVSKPLTNLTAETPSPFFDTTVMELLWREMETIANDYAKLKDPGPRNDDILLVCYNGDTSRMATSVLRARGIKAINLMGGMNDLAKEVKKLNHIESK